MENLQERQQLMACFLLSDRLYKMYRKWAEIVNPRMTADEAGLIIWTRAIEGYYQKWNAMPDVPTLQALAQPLVVDIRDDEQMAAVNRDCMAAMTIASSWLSNQKLSTAEVVSQGRYLLGNYLKRRLSVIYGERMQQRPQAVAQLAEELQQHLASVDGAVGAEFQSLFPGGYFPERKAGAFAPVGIGFIDEMCGGGLLDGEVVGHMAPIGQGKTTLVSQVCHSRCMGIVGQRIKEARAAKREIDLRHVPQIYFFVYEQVENLQANYVSNAAMIPRDICMKALYLGREQTPFSSAAKQNWKKYERKMFAAQFEQCRKLEQLGSPDIKWPNGEMDRFQEAVRYIDAMVRIVDFSGHTASLRGYAEDGVMGMRNYIDAHQESIGNPGVDFIAIDFVGALVDLGVASGQYRPQDRTDIIRTMPNDLGRMLAGRYHCPVWAAHQMGPSEQKRKGGTRPDETAGQGSGMFLTYCAVGIASGKLTSENVAVYVLSKQRRLQVTAADVYLGRLDNMFARWVPATGFSFHDGAVVPVGEVSRSSRGGKFKIPPAGGVSERYVE